MQIDFHLLKQTTTLNLYTEENFRLYGRHVEHPLWRHNSAADRRLLRNLAGKCKMACGWPPLSQHRNRK